MHDSLAKALSRIHSAAYRLSGGRIGTRLVDNDMLLLTTTGRQTGWAHTVPLLYLVEGPSHVVFASWGGRDRHPEWYLNLLEEPRATIRVGPDTMEVTARTTSGEERSALWSRAVDAYGGYETYRARTDREIPVVLLEPRTRSS